MKPVIAFILLSHVGLLGLSSCDSCAKRGNGKVVTQNRKVSSFDKISIEGVFPVEISQDGNAEAVKVMADKNLQQYIKVTNDGDRLEKKWKTRLTCIALKK